MQEVKSKAIFTPLELAEAKKQLIYERTKVLPISVDTGGYYYDPHELYEYLKKNPPIPERKIRT